MINRRLAIVGAGVVLLAPAHATAQQQVPVDAAGYLERMSGAQTATYRARELVVYFGEQQSAAVLDVRSSPSGQFVRAESGESVTRLWRQADRSVVSTGAESINDAAPPAVALRPQAVLAKYEVRIEDPQDVIGVELVPLALQRRSDGATVERLWLHAPSGMVYRRELYGVGGKLVGLSAILDMRWGEPVAPDPFEPGERAPSRVETTSATDAPPALANGYRLIGTYRFTSSAEPADHWVYSDGLHALSVFRSRGGLRAPDGFAPAELGATRGWAGPGPGTWAWEGGGSSWVILAEEPALDPDRLTAPFPRGGPSALARMGSIWSRAFRTVASVFD